MDATVSMEAMTSTLERIPDRTFGIVGEMYSLSCKVHAPLAQKKGLLYAATGCSDDEFENSQKYPYMIKVYSAVNHFNRHCISEEFRCLGKPRTPTSGTAV